jgi:hypothetical protein
MGARFWRQKEAAGAAVDRGKTACGRRAVLGPISTRKDTQTIGDIQQVTTYICLNVCARLRVLIDAIGSDVVLDSLGVSLWLESLVDGPSLLASLSRQLGR